MSLSNSRSRIERIRQPPSEPVWHHAVFNSATMTRTTTIQSSPGGNSSSMILMRDTLISVESLPRSTSLAKWVSTCI